MSQAANKNGNNSRISKDLVIAIISLIGGFAASVVTIVPVAYLHGREIANLEARLKEAEEPDLMKDLKSEFKTIKAENDSYQKELERFKSLMKQKDDQLAEEKIVNQSLKNSVNNLLSSYKAAEQELFLQERIVDTERTIAGLWRERNSTYHSDTIEKLTEKINFYQNVLSRYQSQLAVCSPDIALSN